MEDETDDLLQERGSPSLLGGMLRRLTMLAILALPLVAFAPQILSWSGTAGLVVRYFTSGSDAHVDIGRADLAWWEPVSLYGLTFTLPAEALTVEIDELHTTRSLISLCLAPNDVGKVRLVAPRSSATIPDIDSPTPEGVAPVAIKSTSAKSWVQKLRAEVVAENGTFEVKDASGVSWKLESVDGRVAVPGNDSTDLHVDFKAVLADEETSKIQVRADVTMGSEGHLLASSTGELEAGDFPLELLNPVLVWMGDHARLGGRLTGKANFRYDAATSVLVLDTDAGVRNLLVNASALEPDRLNLEQFQSRVQIEITPVSLNIIEGRITCDLGGATGKGALRWDNGNEPASRTLRVEGTVDLPTLAAKLPHLVRVRDDVTIDAGTLAVSIHPVTDKVGRVDAACEVRELRARCKGAPIEWPRPVHVAARVGSDDAGAWLVDNFTCDSDFLRAKGSGSLSSMDVTAVCDLGRLQERLGQFIDLGDTRLAGRMTGRVQSTRTESGGISLRGAARGEEVTIRSAGQTLLAEPLFNAQFQLVTNSSELASARAGAIVLKNDSEQLTAHLRTPPADWINGPWGTWDIQASGDLAQIRRRLEPITEIVQGWETAGLGVFSARLTLGKESADFQDLVADVQNFRFVTPNKRIIDPRVRLTTSGRFDADKLVLELGRTALLAEAIQLRTDQVRGRLTEEGLALTSTADVAADLGRIRGWTLAEGTAVDLSGQFQGSTQIESDGRRWLARLDGEIKDARYGAGPQPLIDEPVVQIVGQAGTDLDQEGATLREFRASVPGLAITASGEIREISTTRQLRLEGLIDYDWNALAPRLRNLLGDQVTFEGRDRRTFRLEGPLGARGADLEFTAGSTDRVAAGRFPGLKGEVSLGWERANLFGFLAGAANLDGKLEQSWLVSKPVNFPLSGGAMLLRPGIFFGTQATFLHHPPGAIAKNVRVTREMCAGALQYIAPVLAKSVDCEGNISLEVGEIKVPLGAMNKAEFTGKLFLHDVRASGSPLVQELLVLTEGQPIVEIAKDSEVPFRVADGRVFHENMQVKLPGMTIRTSGSVGFDRTLALVVETPLPKKWATNEKVAQLLGSTTIKVPLGGTLDKPQIDRQAIERQIGETIGKGAGKTLEKEINKQIDKQLGNFLDKLR